MGLKSHEREEENKREFIHSPFSEHSFPPPTHHNTRPVVLRSSCEAEGVITARTFAMTSCIFMVIANVSQAYVHVVNAKGVQLGV